MDGRPPNGLLIPPRFSPSGCWGPRGSRLQKTLLQLPGAQPQDYTEQVGDILTLLRGDYRSPEGVEAEHPVRGGGHPLPGTGRGRRPRASRN